MASPALPELAAANACLYQSSFLPAKAEEESASRANSARRTRIVLVRSIDQFLDVDGLKYRSNLPGGIVTGGDIQSLIIAVRPGDNNFVVIGRYQDAQWGLLVDRGHAALAGSNAFHHTPRNGVDLDVSSRRRGGGDFLVSEVASDDGRNRQGHEDGHGRALNRRRRGHRRSRCRSGTI